MSSTTGTTSGTVTSSLVNSGGSAVSAAAGAAASGIKAEEAKVVGFFEAHPKAIAIGAAAAGAFVTLVLVHIL